MAREAGSEIEEGLLNLTVTLERLGIDQQLQAAICRDVRADYEGSRSDDPREER